MAPFFFPFALLSVLSRATGSQDQPTVRPTAEPTVQPTTTTVQPTTTVKPTTTVQPTTTAEPPKKCCTERTLRCMACAVGLAVVELCDLGRLRLLHLQVVAREPVQPRAYRAFGGSVA